MTVAWRLWVLVLTALAATITVYGMHAGMSGAWWPIAALWLTTTLASFGLSIWVAGNLILLGLVMDYMGDAPIGAWPLALLAAYAVAGWFHRGQPRPHHCRQRCRPSWICTKRPHG